MSAVRGANKGGGGGVTQGGGRCYEVSVVSYDPPDLRLKGHNMQYSGHTARADTGFWKGGGGSG